MLLLHYFIETLTRALQSIRRLLCPWNAAGKNIGVGCHFFLRGIFLTQGLNPGLLHCRQIVYCLSHWENHGLYAGIPTDT